MRRVELRTTVTAEVVERWIVDVDDDLFDEGDQAVFDELQRGTGDRMHIRFVENESVTDERDREMVSFEETDSEEVLYGS